MTKSTWENTKYVSPTLQATFMRICHTTFLVQRKLLDCDLADMYIVIFSTVTRLPLAARRCGPQPVVSHSIPTTSDTTAGTVVTISCMFGFGFPDGFTTKKVECDETSLVWVYDSDPSTFRCVGKRLQILLVKLKFQTTIFYCHVN